MLTNIIGTAGLILLSICAFPQLIKSIKDGNSAGFSIYYLLMLESGFVCMLTYIGLTSKQIPIMLNYIINIITIGIILKYRVLPRKTKNESNIRNS